MESTTSTETVSAGNGASAAPATGEQAFEVRNPATGETIRTLSVDSPGRVREVVARVRSNQAGWEALGNTGRHRHLARLRDWLIDNYDLVADTMQS